MPWLGGDLQTLRDTLKPPRLPVDLGEHVPVPMACGGQLLAVHDHCPYAQGLVLLLHGLGGHSDREGLRRMGLALQAAGFSVLRLNLRGAGKGRALASLKKIVVATKHERHPQLMAACKARGIEII